MFYSDEKIKDEKIIGTNYMGNFMTNFYIHYRPQMGKIKLYFNIID